MTTSETADCQLPILDFRRTKLAIAIKNRQSLNSLFRRVARRCQRSAFALSQLAAGAALELAAIIVLGLTADREHALDLLMWPGNDVDANQLAHPAGRSGAGVGGSLHGAYVPAHKNCYITRADILLTQQLNIGRFDHGVSSFHRA